jgi:ADP-ribose pyrophosphatase YjhB (NUDIX family)
MDPDWLERARRLQAIAQTGLAFTRDAFDRERYEAIRVLAAEMIAAGAGDALTTMAAQASAQADGGSDPLDRGTVQALEAIFAAQSGYATPKVDVRAAVFHEHRILLVRERSDGRWTLPGGWADVGDSPSRAVEREVLEESGYAVRAVKLAAVYDRNRHGHTPHLFHIWKLFFLCELEDGTAIIPGPPEAGGRRRDRTRASNCETDAADFFPEDALPPLSLGRVTAAQIAQMFEHHRDPHRAASFD